MKKGLAELVFILDRSGSMSGLEADTIGGFNSMLEKQKRETGEALVSVVLFDDRTEVLYDREDIHKIEPMNDCHWVFFSNGSPSVPSRYFCVLAANAAAISSFTFARTALSM